MTEVHWLAMLNTSSSNSSSFCKCFNAAPSITNALGPSPDGSILGTSVPARTLFRFCLWRCLTSRPFLTSRSTANIRSKTVLLLLSKSLLLLPSFDGMKLLMESTSSSMIGASWSSASSWAPSCDNFEALLSTSLSFPRLRCDSRTSCADCARSNTDGTASDDNFVLSVLGYRRM
ncbi:unnamed protein product [Pseudo-nitzschia multistriata]|uniref:Uncharacterized protein n=1 Tax=Pseudo-nitzschia multistriata TaxID=183589 RepID=A0A448YY66_9STRA|nr:unnamed protein product [Pseudo-nitzschia multistriata]